MGPAEILASFQAVNAASAIVFAGHLRDRAIELEGEAEYHRKFQGEWETLRSGELFKGLEVTWGEGMEAVAQGWDRLAKGEVGPHEALAFVI